MLCLLGHWMLHDSNVKLTTGISYLNLGADPPHSEAFYNGMVNSLTQTTSIEVWAQMCRQREDS